MSGFGSFLGDGFGGCNEEAPETPEATGPTERVAEVQAILAELRPMFQADGGDILLLSVDEEGVVVVRMQGACAGCGAGSMTLYGAILPRLQERLEWVSELRPG
ncbi:MAG TPA: NifU family protein [Planctomycetota bacterium]|jgi:Fe-S cluster biogenesis protein NfuA|nr:NifU family protein [Planctomycetota bacterium]